MRRVKTRRRESDTRNRILRISERVRCEPDSFDAYDALDASQTLGTRFCESRDA